VVGLKSPNKSGKISFRLSGAFDLGCGAFGFDGEAVWTGGSVGETLSGEDWMSDDKRGFVPDSCASSLGECVEDTPLADDRPSDRRGCVRAGYCVDTGRSLKPVEIHAFLHAVLAVMVSRGS
jgi:hypothetical protein